VRRFSHLLGRIIYDGVHPTVSTVIAHVRVSEGKKMMTYRLLLERCVTVGSRGSGTVFT
jgi:hypothetical protein